MFDCRLAPVLKTIFHQCVISYTCSKSNSDGRVRLKYCHINKKRENRLKVHLFTLFSLDILDMRIEKAAVFFDKIFNLIFLLYFSVIRWNFGIFLVLFNGGVLLLVEWT